MRRHLKVGALTLAAVLGVGVGSGPVGAATVEAAVDAAPRVVAGSPRTVTLITGDRVLVRARDGGGEPILTIRPAKGREGVPFIRRTQAGDAYVIPTDAAALVASGRLDQRLFNVTKLVEFGYDDRSRADLPLIVRYSDGASARTGRGRVATSGARLTRGLRSVNGDALAVDKASMTAFWRTTLAAAPGGAARALATGVAKVWLDGPVAATLDQSVAQIGAPAAVRAGHRGQGVKVAVLDTGIDRTHPDLADAVVAERDFTSSDSGPRDRFGHGTHVASIITGSGVAFNGRYQGVAPDAALINGKVLGDTGEGSDSGIIAGMEWAVDQGAAVINMSLGSNFPGDGHTDPMDEAVNRLSADSGALFVVAAGNAGPSRTTVSSPGSADAALTVGAVDRQDALAEFSGRGPRWGDLAIKPDITAPGVGIAAALAKDSLFAEREPTVDGAYVRLNGTSMATPHVAGAAAILASSQPSWDADELKAALMGSAAPQAGPTVYEQGAGRVDVARAVTQRVFASPASVSNGLISWPHQDDRPISTSLTYRNAGTTPVTLAFTVDVRDPAGRPAPAGMFTISPARLTVPAGGSAAATLVTNTAVTGPDGTYGGLVTAVAGQTAVLTPVGVTREVESYDVTVAAVDRRGHPASDYFPVFVNLARPEAFVPFDPSGRVRVRLPKGRYHFEAFVGTAAENPGADGTWALFAEPVLDITRNLSMTIDARQARPSGFTVDRNDARAIQGEVGFGRLTPFGLSETAIAGPLDHILVRPSRSTAPQDEFAFHVEAHYARPDRAGTFFGSPYLYHLRRDVPARIPTELIQRVRNRDLHTVRSEISATAPHQLVTKDFLVELNAPATLVEHYSPGQAFLSAVFVITDVETKALISETISARTIHPRAGQSTERWNAGVISPALPDNPHWGTFVGRRQNSLEVVLAGQGDQTPYHFGRVTSVDTEMVRLRRDGRVIGENPGAGGLFELPPRVGTYRLEYSARQGVLDLSTSVRTMWTFRSGEVPGEDLAPLPVMVVRFAPNLDGYNRAQSGRTFSFPVYVQRQAGATFGSPRTLRVLVSYDDGRTWRPVSLSGRGLQQIATVRHPGGTGFVSLKAYAEDSRGNSVEQTIIRAYGLKR